MIALKILFWIVVSIPVLILVVGVPILASVLYESSPQDSQKEPARAVQLEFDSLNLKVRETVKMR